MAKMVFKSDNLTSCSKRDDTISFATAIQEVSCKVDGSIGLSVIRYSKAF
jgi:hypothetical protein